MLRITTSFAVAAAITAAVACQPAPVGVRNVEVPRDAGQQCASLCGQVGMHLQSLVIMANNVGCVCGSTVETDRPSAGGAAAGGMAAIMLQEAAAQQQQATQPRHAY